MTEKNIFWMQTPLLTYYFSSFLATQLMQVQTAGKFTSALHERALSLDQSVALVMSPVAVYVAYINIIQAISRREPFIIKQTTY